MRLSDPFALESNWYLHLLLLVVVIRSRWHYLPPDWARHENMGSCSRHWVTKLIPVPLRPAGLRGLFHLVCSCQGLQVQMISLVFYSYEHWFSFEMLHASSVRRILCKRKFM